MELLYHAHRFLRHFLCISPATLAADLKKRQPRSQEDFRNIDMTMVAQILEKKIGKMPFTLQVACCLFQIYPFFWGFWDTASVHANMAAFVFLRASTMLDSCRVMLHSEATADQNQD